MSVVRDYDIPRKQSEKQSWNRFSAKSIKQIRFASYWIAANQKIHNKNPMKPHGPFNMFTLMQVLSRFLSTNLLFIVLGTYISITLIKFLRRMKFERLMIPISIYCQFIQYWPNLKKDVLIRMKKDLRVFHLLLTVPLNYELKPDRGVETITQCF